MSCLPEALLDGRTPAYDDFLDERRKLMAQKIKVNWPLLDLLAAVCDVLVTTDQNPPFQQRLHARPFGAEALSAVIMRP